LDDMYDPGTSWLWKHGTWVNGGHWSTCEARMIMGYYRLGKHEDARKSMQHLLTFVENFRMDNPLVEWGSKVYQPKEPINLCYDSFGPPAAMVRGLFEYIYKAESLILMPHIPKGITQISQHFPIRFGSKKIYISTKGSGAVSGVRINGQAWTNFDDQSASLDYEKMPDQAFVEILLGGAIFEKNFFSENKRLAAQKSAPVFPYSGDKELKRIKTFLSFLRDRKLEQTYEGRHAALAIEATRMLHQRRSMLERGQIDRLSETALSAADKMYVDTAAKLSKGLAKELNSYTDSNDSQEKIIYQLWIDSEK
jgi:hypothetical protein